MGPNGLETSIQTTLKHTRPHLPTIPSQSIAHNRASNHSGAVDAFLLNFVQCCQRDPELTANANW